MTRNLFTLAIAAVAVAVFLLSLQQHGKTTLAPLPVATDPSRTESTDWTCQLQCWHGQTPTLLLDVRSKSSICSCSEGACTIGSHKSLYSAMGGLCVLRRRP